MQKEWNNLMLIKVLIILIFCLLIELKDFKFVTALVLEIKKIESDGKTKYDTLYSNSIAEAVIHESEIYDAIESIYTTAISNVQNYLVKGSGWVTDLVIDDINISKNNPVVGSSYAKLPKELDHW